MNSAPAVVLASVAATVAVACAPSDTTTSPTATTTATSTPAAAAPPVGGPNADAVKQEWTARARGGSSALGQVLKDMTTAIRARDFPAAAKQCRLTSEVADAIRQSLPAPKESVTAFFAAAADDTAQAAAACRTFGPEVATTQVGIYAQQMQNAANRLNASAAVW